MCIHKTKKDGQKKDDLPKESGSVRMQLNRKTDEKPDEMDRPHGKDGCRKKCRESRGGTIPKSKEKGKATTEMVGR